MTRDENLAHSLKIKFGLSPNEPTAAQLSLIKSIIATVRAGGRIPNQQDWHSAVAAVCPSIGKHVYAGIDNSDLNTLLALANQAAGGQG